jgi:ABC-2 type transport system ATP-binding protein
MMAVDEFAVEVKGLWKSYGPLVALAGIDLNVKRGEVFGILGRNGAGKTTLIEILEGLLEPDRGRVSVLGFDPSRSLDSIKEVIGVQLQKPQFFGKLKVIEMLKQFRSYYKRKTDLEQLLSRVALAEKQQSYIKDLSGGQGQRLALALALINDPEIVFLDEPTTGLDPAIRRQLWHTINEIKQDGRTVLLTTHYIEEAEHLCDRVCIIDAGQIIAQDSPSNLVSAVRGRSARISLTTVRPLDLDSLTGIRTVEASVNGDGHYMLEAENTGPAIMDLVNCIESQENELIDLQIVRATLEDAFLELTGKGI